MKIYQTTVQQFRVNPATDTVVHETIDITNDIILNNYYVQKSMLEKNDPRLYIIIKFIL